MTFLLVKNNKMKKRNFVVITIAMASLIFTSCHSTKKLSSSKVTLKDAYKSDFLIGAALSAEQIEEKEPNAAVLVPQQFNAVTPENIMKAEIIHPQWDKYNFDLGDKLIAYGEKHNIKINGHTLIWHSQLPAFMRNIKDADSVKQYFSNHINTVASHYNGKIFSWDVVNEALNEDGTMRKSIFLEKLGDNFVTDAFRLTQAASPNTELYYNDYNNEQPKKRAGCIALIKKIQAAGVRIDGVGIQGHWRANNIPLKDIEESIIEYSKLGIKVMFTELDLGVLPNPWDGDAADVSLKAEYSAKMNPYANGLPDSIQAKLTKGYQDLFRLFLKYKNNISRITFWGVNDGQSWLNGWPIAGRTNYPLLFDRAFKPKPAYHAVIALKNKN
jgi:endo-1,4-beta-xylanase